VGARVLDHHQVFGVIDLNDRGRVGLVRLHVIELAARGLYLDVPAWGHHVFEVREAAAAP
jgi:hypothetical protein